MNIYARIAACLRDFARSERERLPQRAREWSRKTACAAAPKA